MNNENIQDRAKKYLAKLEPSISGSGGHGKLFAAAVALVQGFALESEVAENILLECFNPRCVPEWSIPEIGHKVESALKANIGAKQRGWLLAGGERTGAVNYTPTQYKPVERQPEPKPQAPAVKVTSFYRENKPDGSNWRIIQQVRFKDGRNYDFQFLWNGDFYEGSLTGNTVENFIYLYDDGEGKPYLLIHRTKWNDGQKMQKRTPIYHFDKAQARYIAGRGGLLPVPFNAVEVKEASIIHFSEGEKCACVQSAFLRRRGALNVDNAVTTSGGSTSWNDSLIPWFIGKDIIFYPDNDEAGRKYIKKVAAALSPVARSIRFIEWAADFPVKGDIADYLKTKEERGAA